MAFPFPALVPSSTRRFAAGQFPSTRFLAYSGKSSRVRNSNVAFGAAVGLTFAALSEADMLLILAHYDSVSGSYDGFNLSSEALSGVANVNDYSFTGSEWVYLDPPAVEDLPCGGHNVTVTLESLPPINVFSAGLDAAVTMQFLAPVAATTSGLSASVALSLLSGVAAEVSALGLTQTVALSLAAGSPGIPATVSGLTAGIGIFFYQLLAGTGGLTQSVTLSFAPGAALIDPNFASVALLLHMNGSNGSTTFTDSSGNNLTVTPAGNTQISTAQSRFGGASAYFDGVGDSLSISDPIVMIGAGDFTVEMFVRPDATQTGVEHILWNQGQGYSDPLISARLRLRFDRTVILEVQWTGDVPTRITSATAVSSTAFTHIAVVRSAGVFRLYVNGTQEGSTTTSNGAFKTNEPVRIGGGVGGADFYTGFIDEVRISKGIARYTANFTPPDAPFPDS